ncbi:MAG: hypothetical protein EAY65_05640 [Alphaproteobacteria bacterium]|nr:MAG: hypothetical protein EAY65_05640 [Alphaproteobacteria bacterium]
MEQSTEKTKKKNLANIKSPIIQAVINQTYVFPNKSAALDKLSYIGDRFIRSSLTNDLDGTSCVLWIRGYDISPEEQEGGYVGNYALIGVELTKDKKYTLSASKLPIELEKHPQRIRKKSKHPDWGYWVLRRVQKNWRYEDINDAYSDLMQLAQDYPDVSIPSQNKVFTIIYHKREGVENPLMRIILELDSLSEGGFTIRWQENTYQRKDEKASKKAEKIEENAPPQQVGRFTSMVMVKQNKRKNIADMVQKNQDEA